MPAVKKSRVSADTERASLFHYNQKDVIGTARGFDWLVKEGAEAAAAFDHAMLGPAITMGLRGLRVDERVASEIRVEVFDEARKLQKKIDKMNKFDWGKGIKPPSLQLIQFIYFKLKCPPQTDRQTGKLTANKDALARIMEHSKLPEDAIPAIEIAMRLSALEEDRKVLDKPRGRDGRFYYSFGVAADVTSRWNSKKSVFNDGANMQAMSKRLRRIFIPDPGKVFVSIDQSQAESLCVAHLAGSKWYIDAHKSGNVHMLVGEKLWPGACKDKDEAKRKSVPWNPEMKYYDLFKRRQHAGNYGQTPYGFSRLAHMPLWEAKRSHDLYFSFIPEIPEWHRSVAFDLKNKKQLTTPMGRVRTFLGRTWDESTLKEAIAHVPQSTISDVNKIILYRAWRDLDPRLLMMLLEIHDGNLGQCAERDAAEVSERLTALSCVQVPIRDDIMVVPTEIEVGHNWGDFDAEINPRGLRAFDKWKRAA